MGFPIKFKHYFSITNKIQTTLSFLREIQFNSMRSFLKKKLENYVLCWLVSLPFALFVLKPYLSLSQKLFPFLIVCVVSCVYGQYMQSQVLLSTCWTMLYAYAFEDGDVPHMIMSIYFFLSLVLRSWNENCKADFPDIGTCSKILTNRNCITKKQSINHQTIIILIIILEVNYNVLYEAHLFYFLS